MLLKHYVLHLVGKLTARRTTLHSMLTLTLEPEVTDMSFWVPTYHLALFNSALQNQHVAGTGVPVIITAILFLWALAIHI